CYQVDIDTHGRACLEFVDTSVARWSHIELSIREATQMDQLVDSMLEKGRDAASVFDGPTVVRCTIRGNGPLHRDLQRDEMDEELAEVLGSAVVAESVDRKSTRLNSSHGSISYAVFCLKKKKRREPT